jgi:hypothetical protein
MKVISKKNSLIWSVSVRVLAEDVRLRFFVVGSNGITGEAAWCGVKVRWWSAGLE